MPALYYLKGLDESVWREPSGDREIPPSQVLKSYGWDAVPRLNLRAWLTDTTPATEAEAMAAAAKLGLPTTGW